MTKSKSVNRDKFRWDIYIIELISRVGVVGAIVIVFLTIFIVRGSAAQHKEFIDKFFLLKWGNGGSYYLYFIITCLVVALVVQFLHYKQRIKLKDERIQELLQERDRLQYKLLKK